MPFDLNHMTQVPSALQSKLARCTQAMRISITQHVCACVFEGRSPNCFSRTTRMPFIHIGMALGDKQSQTHGQSMQVLAVERCQRCRPVTSQLLKSFTDAGSQSGMSAQEFLTRGSRWERFVSQHAMTASLTRTMRTAC